MAYLDRFIGPETNLSGLDAAGWLDIYRKANELQEHDLEFEKEARNCVLELQQGDLKRYKVWEIICSVSRDGFQKIYDSLGVKVSERGESFYRHMLGRIVAYLEHKKLITLSDGALCVYTNSIIGRGGASLPMIVRKSDGGYNYSTTDLAALSYRVKEEMAEWIIYVVDEGQSKHLAMLFEVGRMAGFYSPRNVRLDHVAFGVITGKDGKRLKSRSGDLLPLQEFLDTAQKEALNNLNDQLEKGSVRIKQENFDQASKIIAINAVKFADLSTQRNKAYKCDFSRMMNLESGGVLYIMYAFARINSILSKQGIVEQSFFRDTAWPVNMRSSMPEYLHESEKRLLLMLINFPDVLIQSVESLSPHVLANYLNDVSVCYNEFFRDCRVIGDDVETFRVLLTELAGRVLDNCMHLLGLVPLQEM
uniref:arginine--tRNA ligase n=1 Tax=Magallana gigas TaxID=29159 RepID=K1QAY8_MAGGI